RIDVPVEMPEGVSREGVFGTDKTAQKQNQGAEAFDFSPMGIWRSKVGDLKEEILGNRRGGAPGVVSTECANASAPQPVSSPEQIKVSGGVLQGSATKKVQPAYPAIARAARSSGAVQVQITINESGEVINAQVINGHPSLRAAALQAAKQWRFKPTEV